MVTFSLLLSYEGEKNPRKVADGCSREQLFSVLDKHLMSAEVACFFVVPCEYEVSYKEFTL